MTYLIAWEFRPRPGAQAEFERIYGPEGDWAQLFRRSDGYLGTELLRDREHPGRYLVLDRWASVEHYEQFRKVHGADYKDLDRRCESLTASETAIGTFVTLD